MVQPSSGIVPQLPTPSDGPESLLIGQHLGAWLEKRQSLLPTWRTMFRCSLRQLVLSNVKLRLEQLQIVCQTHNLQGYSLGDQRLQDLFLGILLSSCAWRSIAFNTPNLLTAKPQVVFIHHQLITPRIHWKDGVTGGGRVLEAGVEVREGIFTGHKYAKGYPTQLPVTVDEHPGRLAQGWISHAGYGIASG
ncbi:BQ5605_C018g08724 [Microbotryum silenes-dioicae]|uniref:BQ5605_C018g08724 protein n=1 Tax=Microbotryum silenes-dioicae TaxID=796604 RepID=A0A2X0MRS9_9BASI|nr:BQ5605_C018g08724 [Microbotryum silenes-dioicae]